MFNFSRCRIRTLKTRSPITLLIILFILILALIKSCSNVFFHHFVMVLTYGCAHMLHISVPYCIFLVYGCTACTLYQGDKQFNRYIYSLIARHLLVLSDVEMNPGPIPPNSINYAFWNLDSLLARDGHKKQVIEGLNSVHNFDLFGVVESYLNKNILDNQLQIKGFSPVPFRADAITNNRARGGVCLYFKDNLQIKNRCDLVDLEETILVEIRTRKRKSSFSYPTVPQVKIRQVSYLAIVTSSRESLIMSKRKNPHLLSFQVISMRVHLCFGMAREKKMHPEKN